MIGKGTGYIISISGVCGCGPDIRSCSPEVWRNMMYAGIPGGEKGTAVVIWIRLRR